MQKEDVINYIDKQVKLGNTVKSSCFKLSEGNVALMLKYQRQYYNRKKENKQLNNVLQFEKSQVGLSDADLQNLFMGVIKLIKKSALEEAAEVLLKEKDSLKYLLKKALVELSEKDKEINLLKSELNNLKHGVKSAKKTDKLKQKFSNMQNEDIVSFKK